MDLSDVMELLGKRQGKKSNEQYANEMGIRGSTLWRYKHGQSDINTEAREKLIRYFSERGDSVMIGALLVHRTGTKFSEGELDVLGHYFLTREHPHTDMALAPSN